MLIVGLQGLSWARTCVSLDSGFPRSVSAHAGTQQMTSRPLRAFGGMARRRGSMCTAS